MQINALNFMEQKKAIENDKRIDESVKRADALTSVRSENEKSLKAINIDSHNYKNDASKGDERGKGKDPSFSAAKEVKDKMIFASSSMSKEDLLRIEESGLFAEDMEPDEYVDIADKIRVALAKGGADVSITGGIDKETIESVTGSEKYSAVMEKALKNNDLPTDDETVRESADALRKAEEITEKIPGNIPEKIKDNLLRYENEPTVGNLFDSLKLLNNGALDERGDFETGEIPKDLIPQIENVIKDAGLSVSPESIDMAEDMIKKHIPLTSENMLRATELDKLSLPDMTLEEQAMKISDNILEGKAPLDTDLFKKTLMEESREKYNEILNIVEKTDDISDISYKRQLEEVRLSMTVSANFALLKKGIEIDTGDLSKYVDDLRELEDDLIRSYFKNTTPDEEGVILTEADLEEKINLYKEADSAIADLRSAPAAVLFNIKNINEESINSLNEKAAPITARLKEAGERYETMRTEIRRDLGDSIKKAFSNIDELLKEVGVEDTEDNERAVRILGYNNEEINEENILTVKNADKTVQRAFDALTPAVVTELIKTGKNPIDMKMDDLIKTAEEIKEKLPGNRPDEKFSRFLRKLEEKNGITEEEKQSYIGIYRLIHQVNESDGAAIGMLIQSGQDITMRSLMRAERTRRHENRETVIDDSFGLLTEFKKESLSITEQIELSFNQSSLKDAEQKMSPYKMMQFENEDEYMEMSIEEFDDALRNTEEPEEEALSDTLFELKELKKAAYSEDEVYRLLERFDIEESPVNLLSMQEILKNTAFPFTSLTKNRKIDKDIFNSAADLKDITIDDLLEESIEDYGEAVKTPEDMAKAEKKLYDTAENVIRNAIIDDGLASIDIRAMRLSMAGLSIFSKMAKNETYNIPVNVSDSTGNMTVKIVRGTDEKGLCDILFNSERTGKIRAGFSYEKDNIEGNILTDTREMQEYLSEQGQLLAESMMERTGLSFSLSVGQSDYIEEAEIFKDKRYDFKINDEREDVQTKVLYGIAKAFLDTVKNI